jgi:hypothetical protein
MLQFLLSPETEAALRDRANLRGEEAANYAARILQDALMAPSVDELLRPFRQHVDGSGPSVEGLDFLCEELRLEVWEQRQARKAKSARAC